MAHRANTTRLLVPFVGALLCAAPAFALDPRKAIGQYVFDSWRTQQGLPQDKVTGITQTSDGYLWVATEEGLARFDGARFTVFDPRNTKELPGGLRTLWPARDGSLWIGSANGLTRHVQGAFITYAPPGLGKRDVTCLYEDGRGTLWVGTSAGLHELRPDRVRTYTTKDGLPHEFIRTIREDRTGTLWIGTRGGLARLREGHFQTLTIRDGLAGDVILALHEDRSGAMWAGTFFGLSRIQGGRITTYTTAHGLSHNTVNSLAEDADGNLWIGTYGGGVNRFRDGRFTHFGREDGLGDDLVHALYMDAGGSLWIGTSQGGLARLKDGPFMTVTTKQGLSHDNVLAVHEDGTGALWVATNGGGLNRLAGGHVTTFRARDGLANDIVFALTGDGQDGLWVGTYSGGLHHLSKGRITTVRSRALPANESVLSLLRDRQGTLWVGTYGAGGGLKRLRNGVLETVASEPRLADVGALSEDRDGSLWLGTRHGLCRVRDETVRCFTTRDGLPNDFMHCLYQDAAGSLWMCAGGALARYRDGRFDAWTRADGLFEDNLHQVLEDDQGYLWMSSNRGVFRVRKAELDEQAAGRRKTVTSFAYGVADGMKSAECNGGTQPAGWRGRDGRLWFACVGGVVVVDPARVPQMPPAPPALIEEVVVDGRALPLRPGPDLGPGARRFEFRYTAPYLADASRLRFRYRIDDVDDEWVEAGAQRVAHYTNLPPGRHRFRVISGNAEGAWTEGGAALDFRLRPHFYQTAWFYALCTAGVGLLAYAGHRYRVRRLLEVERVRTRIAGDLHDDIGASLTQIAILSELARRRMNGPDATEPLDRIGRLSRESVDAMGDIVWAIDPQKDRLQHLTQRLRGLAVEVLSTAGIEHRFAGDEHGGDLPLGPDVRREVFLVFKESLNNVVRHSGAHAVDIALTRENGRLVLRVHDDGRGFDTAGAAGNGLRSMRRRAAAVGGGLDVSTGTTGTTVTLSVPI